VSIRDLAVQAAKLCGAEDADREGAYAAFAFDDNEKNPNSVFKRRQGDKINPRKRYEQALAWKPATGMEGKKEYIEDIFVYVDQCHYAIEHGDKEAAEGLEEIRDDLIAKEAVYPDVAAVYSVSAKPQGTWL